MATRRGWQSEVRREGKERRLGNGYVLKLAKTEHPSQFALRPISSEPQNTSRHLISQAKLRLAVMALEKLSIE